MPYISNYEFWWIKQWKFEIWQVCVIWLLRYRYNKIEICGKNSIPLLQKNILIFLAIIFSSQYKSTGYFYSDITIKNNQFSERDSTDTAVIWHATLEMDVYIKLHLQ